MYSVLLLHFHPCMKATKMIPERGRSDLAIANLVAVLGAESVTRG
jgi:hypothetical protein